MNTNLDSIERREQKKIKAGKEAAPRLFSRTLERILESEPQQKSEFSFNSRRLDDIEREGWSKHSGIYAISRSDELYHHGIKGQKWGVRRFQNSDGSLTKAGRERYDNNNDKQKQFADMAEKAISVRHEIVKQLPDGRYSYTRDERKTKSANKNVELSRKKLYNSDGYKTLTSDVVNDENLKAKRKEYEDIANKLYKLDENEDYEWGRLSKKKLKYGDNLNDRSNRLYKEIDADIRKKVESFTGEYGKKSVRQLRGGETNFDSVDDFLSTDMIVLFMNHKI